VNNPQGAIDVPLSLFGGENLELAPPDIPEGVSPGCQDVVFLPGSVASRPGMHRRFPANTFGSAKIKYEKTYIQPNGQPLNLYLTSDGLMWKEDLTNSPGTVTQIGRVIPGCTATSVTFEGREYFAFSDGVHGVDTPRSYDGTNFDRVTQNGPGSSPFAADSATAGVVTPGQHGVVVMYLTTEGTITKASPPLIWWNAGGSKQVTVTNLPIGPANVVARIVAFTGSGGKNFFYIPTTPTVSGAAVGTSTVVLDNTSVTATFNFSDDTLFNSLAIDIPGNNLFAMATLPPCLGVFAYSQRLMYWGMDNVVTSFQDMGFDGGYSLSGGVELLSGWGGQPIVGGLVTSPYVDFGFAYELIATSPTQYLSQDAYQDAYGVPILQPLTQYTFKVWGIASNSGGNVVAEFYSATGGGVLASATVPATAFPNVFSGQGAFADAVFSAKTPTVIPSDTLLRIYATGTADVIIDELEIIYTDDPYVTNELIGSYVQAPEQFDSLTGVFGPATDPSPVQCCSILRDTMRIKTTQGIHTTVDNGSTEPDLWTISTFSRTVGAVSIRGGDPGMFGSGDTAEDWDLTASRGGLYIDFAGDLYKISQEEQKLWDSINWDYAHEIWIKNDTVVRRVYVGLPTGTATTPNVVAVMDYRELDAALQIASAAPVHISFTGKMISSDLTRKWTTWTIPANCGEILMTGSSGREFCIGYGTNSYYFDSAKLTDDDLGQIYPYYTTFAFLNHEAEVALGTGVHRKLYRYQTIFASGVGALTITPYVDSLSSPWAATLPFPLQSTPYYDIENGLNVMGERCFFKLASAPLQSRIVYVTAPNIIGVDYPRQFAVGQTIQVVPALGSAAIGTATITSIDLIKKELTVTPSYPVGTAMNYYVISTNWPDNSFNLNKLVTSIQAEPWAPVRGAW